MNESTAHTVARDIERGNVTFEEIAASKPIDADRLVVLFDAVKAAEAAYRAAVDEECKRSGQSRMSVGHVVDRARKRRRKPTA